MFCYFGVFRMFLSKPYSNFEISFQNCYSFLVDNVQFMCLKQRLAYFNMAIPHYIFYTLFIYDC